MERSPLGRGGHAATVAAFALLAACGGGGGSTPDMNSAQSASTSANVSIASITPSNNSASVPVTTSPSVSFTVDNGTYLSHALNLTCGGSNVATTQIVTSVAQGNVTTQVITLTPASSLPFGVACQLQGQVNGSPSGGTSGTVSASFTTAQSQFAPKLIAGGGGVAGSVIDLTTGAQSLPWNAGTCWLDGASLNPASGKVHLSCTSGAQPQLTYDPLTGALNALTLPPVPLPSVAAPVACAPSGKCYYGFGQEGSATSDGRVVVVQNAVVVSTITLPGQSLNRIPTNLKVVGTKMWVLEQQPSAKLASSTAAFTASLSRVDLNTEKIDFTLPLDSQAVDFAANDRYAVVTVYRSIVGKDVLAFDAVTGALVGSIVLAAPSAALTCFPSQICGGIGTPRFLSTAFGVAISGSTIYVSATDGVYSHSLVSLTQLAAQRPPASEVQARSGPVAFGNGKLYFSFYGFLYELDRTTLDITRTFPNILYNGGSLYVAEPQ